MITGGVGLVPYPFPIIVLIESALISRPLIQDYYFSLADLLNYPIRFIYAELVR